MFTVYLILVSHQKKEDQDMDCVEFAELFENIIAEVVSPPLDAIKRENSQLPIQIRRKIVNYRYKID